MSESKEHPKNDDRAGAVEIRYSYPRDWQNSVFANHFTVQQSPAGEFTLSFFEVREPAQMMGCSEGRQQKLEEIGYVDAVCVATVVMTKPRILQVLAALAENVTKTPGAPKAKSIPPADAKAT